MLKLRHVSHKAYSTQAEKPVIVNNHTANVAEFVLNSPKTLNSLNNDMIDVMLPVLKDWRNEPETAPRVCLITGAGEKAFCAGGDIV